MFKNKSENTINFYLFEQLCHYNIRKCGGGGGGSSAAAEGYYFAVESYYFAVES